MKNLKKNIYIFCRLLLLFEEEEEKIEINDDNH